MLLHRILSGSTIALLILTVAGSPDAVSANGRSLAGIVESGGTGLAGYEVSLYARFIEPPGTARVLGRATAGPSGEFKIDYHLPHGQSSPLLFIRAISGPAMLASAIGQAPVAGSVVVNERTTVATGFAYAQFVDGYEIRGNSVGMLNAVRMTANMVHAETGTLGRRSSAAAERFGNVGAANLQLPRQHGGPLHRGAGRLPGALRRDHAAGRAASDERPSGGGEHR
jgi:hypothetical protein